MAGLVSLLLGGVSTEYYLGCLYPLQLHRWICPAAVSTRPSMEGTGCGVTNCDPYSETVFGVSFLLLNQAISAFQALHRLLDFQLFFLILVGWGFILLPLSTWSSKTVLQCQNLWIPQRLPSCPSYPHQQQKTPVINYECAQDASRYYLRGTVFYYDKSGWIKFTTFLVWFLVYGCTDHMFMTILYLLDWTAESSVVVLKAFFWSGSYCLLRVLYSLICYGSLEAISLPLASITGYIYLCHLHSFSASDLWFIASMLFVCRMCRCSSQWRDMSCFRQWRAIGRTRTCSLPKKGICHWVLFKGNLE
jgi:hypothetical protein